MYPFISWDIYDLQQMFHLLYFENNYKVPALYINLTFSLFDGINNKNGNVFFLSHARHDIMVARLSGRIYCAPFP